jgi:hypothetical protein
MTQYFFVDESGDPGPDLSKNSPYYVVAMVQVPNRDPMIELAKLRQELRLAPGFEFHFYRANARQKELFFQAVQPFLFRVRAVALRKANMSPEFRGLTSLELEMELITRLTLRASALEIANDILVLDSAPDRFLKSLRIHFTQAYRQEQRERPFKKIISSDSKHDDGLQLADMIAGAIRLSTWENDPTYYRMFAKKVAELWLIG